MTRQADADIRQVTPPGAAGTAAVPIGRVYRFGQIVEAHTDMEQNRATGKLVVVPGPAVKHLSPEMKDNGPA